MQLLCKRGAIEVQIRNGNSSTFGIMCLLEIDVTNELHVHMACMHIADSVQYRVYSSMAMHGKSDYRISRLHLVRRQFEGG